MELSSPFVGKGYWALVLGGSSGFGLATAHKLAASGFNIILGHRDSQGRVESELSSEFENIRANGVKLVTFNGNLSEPEPRGEFFALIEASVPKENLYLFLHSIADGSCKPLVEPTDPQFKQQALKELSGFLAQKGINASEGTLREGVNFAFHERACDAFANLADSRIPFSSEEITEADLAKTVMIMGFDFLSWSRELLRSGLFAKKARLIGLTSEGNEKAWPGYAGVSAAKVTLEAISRSMALEFAPHNIRSCIVQPGVTDTRAGNGIPQFDLMKAHARMRNPFRRLTRTEDVADAIYGLCLPYFDWVNGEIIRVDGGEAIAA